jgi:hypothetical protein
MKKWIYQCFYLDDCVFIRNFVPKVRQYGKIL